MTITTPAIDQAAAQGKESMERAQAVLAAVADRLADAAADAPRVVDSWSDSARDAAADLPEDLSDLVPPSWTSRSGLGITPLQGALVVGVAVLMVAMAAAIIRRSRRRSARRHRSANSQSS